MDLMCKLAGSMRGSSGRDSDRLHKGKKEPQKAHGAQKRLVSFVPLVPLWPSSLCVSYRRSQSTVREASRVRAGICRNNMAIADEVVLVNEKAFDADGPPCM